MTIISNCSDHGCKHEKEGISILNVYFKIALSLYINRVSEVGTRLHVGVRNTLFFVKSLACYKSRVDKIPKTTKAMLKNIKVPSKWCIQKTAVF
jgi:hypothetical protein